MSPSGKATGSGPVMRGFESYHPSQILAEQTKISQKDESEFSRFSWFWESFFPIFCSQILGKLNQFRIQIIIVIQQLARVIFDYPVGKNKHTSDPDLLDEVGVVRHYD